MKKRKILGKLTKQEKVNPIERNKLPRTFVVNIPSPLASYFTRFSQINKPNTILLITKGPVSFEQILRATQNINLANDLDIEAAKCEISIGKKKYSGIRLKRVQEYSDIPKIQELYQKEGFDMARNVRIKEDTDSMIRVNKFYNLKKVSDGIYRSRTNKDYFYFVIPKGLNWNEFRDLTFDIKHNTTVSGYDVAKGIFYENGGVTEMVRVTKPKVTLKMVKEIQKKYLERLS